MSGSDAAVPGSRQAVVPSAAELAAIVAAVELVWPRAVVVESGAAPEAPRWRFSGRWWSRPVPSRRERPW